MTAAGGGPAQTVQPPAAVLPVLPLRIERLVLTDFRAFPGPAPTEIVLGGKNLLIYGENGAGKTSIFHALREFFSLKPQRKLPWYENVFSTVPDGSVSVELLFNDQQAPAKWFVTPLGGSPQGRFAANSVVIGGATFAEFHPATVKGATDQRVVQAALRRACLDYRSLLETNYRHGDEAVDLFEIAVSMLLADYDYTPPGGVPVKLRDLWARVQGNLHGVAFREDKHTAMIVSACQIFNGAMQEALTKLQPVINDMLVSLKRPELQLLKLTYTSVGPKAARLRRDRGLNGGTLRPAVSYRGYDPATPQTFLNEARLSALALAIYLAGRLACTPAADAQSLKLLVLDDVLIGLDHANRMPVLDVLRDHFADWQVVLLTHDIEWFNLSRKYLGEDEWNCIEVFEGNQESDAPIPIVRKVQNRPSKQHIQLAKQFLGQKHIEAAANHTRKALEACLLGGMEFQGIRAPFKQDYKDLKLDDLLSLVEGWAKEDDKRKSVATLLAKVRLHKDVVMNPYSHSGAPNIPESEVKLSNDVVEKLILELGKKY